MRQAVIFDLDGTLTQSEEGIWNSVRHVCEQMNLPVPDAQTLRKFIGPPLQYSFTTFMGLSEARAEDAVRVYRERYQSVGLFENRVYPGIRRLVRTLKKRGAYLAVATGKPTEPSRRILAHFGLLRYFDRVIGPMDGAAEKDQLIREALPDAWDEAWMVGDRKFDVEGGRRVGVKTIGVGYGYGSEEELRAAGCDAYAPTVQALIDILCPGETPPKGAFISMEGLDGSGKSTQIAYLTDALSRYGFEVAHSREPGGSPIGEKIRTLLLSTENAGMTAETEALLYAASRAQHVRQVIRPAVEKGQVLLCDRYVDSSAAYQGGGRGLGVETVLALNKMAVDGCLPLATVYLRLGHAAALKRRMNASAPDRMEMEADSFHARVEAAYEALIAREPERFVVVDASQSPEKIGEDAAQEVLRRLMEAEANG